MRPASRDWQRALFIPLTILAWLVLVVIAGWLLSHVVKTILTLVLSGVVAFALTPLVSLFSRKMPRVLAIALAYVIGFGVVIGLGALIVVTATAQVTNLVHDLPAYAGEAQRLEPQVVHVLGPFGVTAASYHHAEHQLISYLQGIGTSTAKASLSIITGVVGTIVDIVLVLILSVYLTANGPNIALMLRRETPGAQRKHTVLLIAIVNQVVGGYVRGTLTLAALVGVLVGVGMYILHVPYAILLGVLAFFMEFVPIVGVLVSGAISITIALFQGWFVAVLVAAYFVLVHIMEGDVVGPRIMGRAVGIHPATALVALVAGTELFGLWGALFGAPIAGLLQAIGTAVWREMRGADPDAVLKAVVKTAEHETVKQTGAVDTDGVEADGGAVPAEKVGPKP